MRSVTHSSGFVFAMVFAAAMMTGRCGGAGGCTSCNELTPIPNGPYPQSHWIGGGIQIRLSESGVQFFEANAGQLITDLLPGGTTFPVPPQCDVQGNLDVCGDGDPANCVGQNPPCEVSIMIEDVTIVPQDPPGNQLDVEVRVNIASVNDFELNNIPLIGDCTLSIDTSNQNGGSIDGVRLQVPVFFDVDTVSGRTAVTLGNATMPPGEIEGDDIEIGGGGFGCGFANLDFIKNLLIGQLEGQLAGMIGPLVQGALGDLCAKCDQGQTCPALSSCDGVDCQEDSGAGCVQALGLEGRLALGGLVSSLSPGNTGGMDLHVWLGNHAFTDNNGISLGTNAGAMTPGHNDCVPERPEPDYSDVAPSNSFRQNTRPTDGNPYMMGIGIHKQFLDAVGYAMYDSGLLCITLGPREVDLLTAGTFSLVFPSIYDLSHGEEAPIVLAIRPQNPLVFELGDGTITQDPGTGEYTIVDPLFTITSTDFAVDFYVQIDYRLIRAFRLTTDLAIPMALTVNAQNQLVPIMGDFSDAFTNVRVTDASLMAEDPATMAALFPTLLGLMGGFLGDIFPPIDLPDLQGFQLVLDDGSITSVDNYTFMAIYADLAYVGPKPKAGGSVHTVAEIVHQYTPETEAFEITSFEDYQYGPTVTLEFGADGVAEGAPLEWQYSINGGPWSPFTDSPTVTLRRPVFFVQGWHYIDVRGRVKGEYQSLDPTPRRLHFAIDSVAPRLTADRVGSQVMWHATDMVTAAANLEYRARVGQGAWTTWQRDLTSLTVSAANPDRIEIEVRDEAGNESRTVLGLYGRVEVPPDPNGGCLGGGCVASGDEGSGTGTGVAIGLALLALLGWRRRRRVLPFALLALALGALVAIGCGGKSSGTNNNCGPNPPPLTCTDPGFACNPGEEIVGNSPMEWDNLCQPIPVDCSCQALPAIEPGDFGRFLSLDARDGRILLSCYSDRWTDLVVADVDEFGSLTPTSVDGVPAGPVTGDPTGYRGGVSDQGPDIGQFTSLVLDSAGVAHVSYKDVDNGTLKYATNASGNWEVHVVAQLVDPDEEVWYTAIQLGGGENPEIAFMVNNLVDANVPGGRVSQLRYARAGNPSPTSDADWTVEVVDEPAIPCAGLCDAGELCVDSTWICEAEDSGGCAGGCGTDEGCVADTCVAVLPDPGNWQEHPEGIGLYVHTGTLSNGDAVLAYHDRTLGTARYAVYDGAAWTAYLVEGDAFSDMGLYISLAVATDDTLHFSYTDAGIDELIYAQWDTAGGMLVREVVDDGKNRPDETTHAVGLDGTVFLDAAGNPQILYQDGTNADLLLAVRTGVATWTVTPVAEGDPGYGFFVDTAVDTDGSIWGAQYVYDRSTPALSRIEVWQL